MAESDAGSQQTRGVRHQTVTVAGLDVFYREAGPADAPALLLPHGFPAASHQYARLMDQLGDRFHLVAADYPGFGYSSAPASSNGLGARSHCTKWQCLRLGVGVEGAARGPVLDRSRGHGAGHPGGAIGRGHALPTPRGDRAPGARRSGFMDSGPALARSSGTGPGHARPALRLPVQHLLVSNVASMDARASTPHAVALGTQRPDLPRSRRAPVSTSFPLPSCTCSIPGTSRWMSSCIQLPGSWQTSSADMRARSRRNTANTSSHRGTGRA